MRNMTAQATQTAMAAPASVQSLTVAGAEVLEGDRSFDVAGLRMFFDYPICANQDRAGRATLDRHRACARCAARARSGLVLEPPGIRTCRF